MKLSMMALLIFGSIAQAADTPVKGICTVTNRGFYNSTECYGSWDAWVVLYNNSVVQCFMVKDHGGNPTSLTDDQAEANAIGSAQKLQDNGVCFYLGHYVN